MSDFNSKRSDQPRHLRPAPQMSPYARHILICNGESCDPEQRGSRLYMLLARHLGDLADYDNPERVKRGKVSCLGVCTAGPIVVVYPEGIWYHQVDDALLERIVNEHLRNGQPVEERIFHRLEDQPD